MNDFDIFSKLDFSNNNSLKNSKINSCCNHTNFVIESGIKLCIDCGFEISLNISGCETDWKYSSSKDKIYIHDISRIQIRCIKEDYGIFKDVEGMGFSDKVVSLANEYYNKITKGEIRRGKSRKSFIFACIFHAYATLNDEKCCDSLKNRFGLDKKELLKGLRNFELTKPDDLKLKPVYITPAHLVDDMIDKLNGTEEQKIEIKKLYNENIYKKSDYLYNRCRPKSVCAGLIWYYYLYKKKNINIKDFKEKLGLSDLTIEKIAKEISRILNTPHILPFK